MNLSPEKEFFVRPLGKYGYLYRLDSRSYQLYRFYLVGLTSGIIIFGLVQITGKTYDALWPISDNAFFLLLILSGTLGGRTLMKIASHGKKVHEHEVVPEPKVSTHFLYRVLFLIISLLGGLLIFFLIGGVMSAMNAGTLSMQQAIEGGVVIILAFCGCVKSYCKWRAGS